MIPPKIIFLAFLLVILEETISAQTFQYSRGWTSGKKRLSIPLVFQEQGDESLGICQIGRLRELLGIRKHEQVYLPCEILAKTDEETTERFRRKTDFENV